MVNPTASGDNGARWCLVGGQYTHYVEGVIVYLAVPVLALMVAGVGRNWRRSGEWSTGFIEDEYQRHSGVVEGFLR